MTATINASTSSGLIQTADTSGELALQSNGTTQLTVSSTGAYGQLKSGTAVSASGTSVDFTSIPSWVKRITIVFRGISTNGTSSYLVQLGSGSIQTTGYTSISGYATGANQFATSTAGFVCGAANINAAAATIRGTMTFDLLTGNTWVGSTSFQHSFPAFLVGAGDVALSGILDRVRITTVSGTQTFDAGSINILYEG